MLHRAVHVGDHVIYVDHYGKARDALITAVWGQADQCPAINVVFVTNDEARKDQYGNQIERDSSVVHESNQAAHGNYWKLA